MLLKILAQMTLAICPQTNAHQGKLAEAEPLFRRALAGREKKLGLNHPDTLTSVNNG